VFTVNPPRLFKAIVSLSTVSLVKPREVVTTPLIELKKSGDASAGMALSNNRSSAAQEARS
jgi:hypothetical protein